MVGLQQEWSDLMQLSKGLTSVGWVALPGGHSPFQVCVGSVVPLFAEVLSLISVLSRYQQQFYT